MVSFAMSCVKYLLFFFNLLFAISGIAILVVGSLLQSVYHNYSKFVNDNFMFLPICIIVVGAVIFIIAFFGCCGTVKENLCMVSTFASLLITIFIVEIVAAVGAFVFKNDVKDIISERMNSSMQFYGTDPEIAKSWDILQTDSTLLKHSTLRARFPYNVVHTHCVLGALTLQCCGVSGALNWKEKIPSSCCKDIHQEEICTEKDAFQIGCLDKMYSLSESNALIIAIIVISVALVQIVGVGFACCLAHSIHKGYETV